MAPVPIAVIEAPATWFHFASCEAKNIPSIESSSMVSFDQELI